jgi:DNA-binding PadR family transcriptional regulator
LAKELTTTSYAILGLLSVKPFTTYEIAEQMKRALGHFWPRAESQFYEEPKRLVERGLAKAAQEQVGRRPRTRYSITPKGRRALAAWVRKAPEGGPVLESDALVRLFFAEHGSRDDLLATIDAVHAWTQQRLAEDRERQIPQDYLAGRGSFPERLPWLVLVGHFLHMFEVMVEEWADWARATVEAWPEDLRDAEPAWDVLEVMAARIGGADRTAPERVSPPG